MLREISISAPNSFPYSPLLEEFTPVYAQVLAMRERPYRSESRTVPSANASKGLAGARATYYPLLLHR
jgi:hypothetical protein